MLVLLVLAGCSRIAVDPARYACTAGGADTQCPGNWRCIRDNFCVDPGTGGPWSCTADTDCTGAWHCGREQHCYDLADAGAITCRRDAGDCAPGWACGLDERCLDTSMPNGNRCDVDLDCFANQRCSANRCITLGDEALRVSDGGPTFTIGQRPFAGARLIAGASTNTSTVLAGVVGGEVRLSEIRAGFRAPFTVRAQFETFSPAPLDPASLAVIDDVTGTSYSVAIVGRDGGAWHFERADGGWKGSELALGSPAKGVRRLEPKGLRWGFFGDNTVSVGSDFSTLALVPGAPVGINDVTAISKNGDGFLIASTAAGGSVRDITGGNVGAGGWQQGLCSKAGPLDGVVMVREVLIPKPAFVAVTTDGGTTSVVTFELVPAPAPGTSTCPMTLGTGTFVTNQSIETFDLHDPTGVIAGREPRADVELTGVGGTQPDGTPGTRWSSNTDNLTAFVPPYGALWSNTNTSSLVMLSAGGDVWLEAGVTIVPQMPRTPPRITVGAGVDLLEGQGPELAVLAPQGTYFTCQQTRLGAACLPTSVDGGFVFYGGPVRGNELWTVRFEGTSGEVRDEDGVLLATQQVTSRVESSGATTTRLTDGGTLLMTRTLDFISWAEVTRDAVGTAVPPALRFAISPLPRGELTDLVLTPNSAAPDARFAEAWAISSGRVFRVHASSPSLWRTEEVPLPTDVEVVRLWLDGSRARGGDRLGVVFALGARVALSQPLPLGEVALEYASSCTNDFVLAASGKLFQLTAGSNTQLATWAVRPTPVPFKRLVERTDGLRGVDASGRAYWFDGLSCLP